MEKRPQQMKPKYSDEDLMKLADGELNDSDLSMRILSDIIDGDKELESRLEVFTKTRNTLINAFMQQEKK
jgi:hypothetical protein